MSLKKGIGIRLVDDFILKNSLGESKIPTYILDTFGISDSFIEYREVESLVISLMGQSKH